MAGTHKLFDNQAATLAPPGSVQARHRREGVKRYLKRFQLLGESGEASRRQHQTRAYQLTDTGLTGSCDNGNSAPTPSTGKQHAHVFQTGRPTLFRIHDTNSSAVATGPDVGGSVAVGKPDSRVPCHRGRDAYRCTMKPPAPKRRRRDIVDDTYGLKAARNSNSEQYEGPEPQLCGLVARPPSPHAPCPASVLRHGYKG